jgi:hypothetical protein
VNCAQQASPIKDAGGSPWARRSGWALASVQRSLDPKHVWQIEAQLGPASDFAATNVHRLVFPPGMTSETATNINGIEFSLRRLKTSATIRLAQELEDRRLTFIEARLADGTTLRPMGSNWGQHWPEKNVETIAHQVIHPRPGIFPGRFECLPLANR